MFRFQPSSTLSEKEVNKGLSLVIKDGLATEAMTTLTGGTFLMALAVYLKATNIQIGIIPSFADLHSRFSIIFNMVITTVQ